MKIKIKDVFEKDEKDIHVQTNERLDIDEIFEDAREERQEMSLEEEKNDATGISDMSVQDSSEEPAVNAGVVEASDDAEQVEPSQDAAEAGPEEVTAAETPDQQEKPGDETCEPAGEQAEAAAAATAETAESPEVAESAELSADTSAEETPLPETPADPDVLIEPEAPESCSLYRRTVIQKIHIARRDSGRVRDTCSGDVHLQQPCSEGGHGCDKRRKIRV